MMTNLFSRQGKIIIGVLTIILITSACLTTSKSPSVATPIINESTPADSTTASANTPTPGGPPVSFTGDLTFGPGNFNLQDPKTGLSDLSSYTATLILSFDGTEAGQPKKWSKTYVMLYSRDPSLRQLTIEKTGDTSNPEQVYMAELDGAVYEQRGTNACFANVVEEGNSISDQFEPAGFLNVVIGAGEAGTETVNDVAANHYSFDERAIGLADVTKSKGELWVATDSGYIVKYLLTTQGNADYFGDGIDGTLIWDYELTNINQAVTVKLPDDCPPGLVNAPVMPDAASVLSKPGILTYDSTSSLPDIAAFYQKEIPSLGWVLAGEPTITDDTILLDYLQGENMLSVIVTNNENGTKVHILLGRVAKQ
jgi:hypothetical protein